MFYNRVCEQTVRFSSRIFSVIWHFQPYLFTDYGYSIRSYSPIKVSGDWKDSVNDDLESLFENIRLGKEQYEEVYTYFLPKLTEEELELVEKRDTCYLETFYENRFGNPDVDETEIMRSESNSKYANGVSRRETFILYEN